MKIFISQPMSCLKPDVVLEYRRLAEEQIKLIFSHEENIEFIDSYLDLGDASPLVYLGESIKLLAEADVMFVLPGWELSRRCELEIKAASLYDISIMYIYEL